MVYITRKFHFSASHRLYKPGLTDEENARIFGDCSNPNGHGHNYIIEVTVSGNPNPDVGYIMDLKLLKNIVDEALIKKVDHKNLNCDVDFLKGIIPTSENLVMCFWEVIRSKIENAERKLFSIKLFETENNYVEFKG